jgi:hypothetical protein
MLSAPTRDWSLATQPCLICISTSLLYSIISLCIPLHASSAKPLHFQPFPVGPTVQHFHLSLLVTPHCISTFPCWFLAAFPPFSVGPSPLHSTFPCWSLTAAFQPFPVGPSPLHFHLSLLVPHHCISTFPCWFLTTAFPPFPVAPPPLHFHLSLLVPQCCISTFPCWSLSAAFPPFPVGPSPLHFHLLLVPFHTPFTSFSSLACSAFPSVLFSVTVI